MRRTKKLLRLPTFSREYIAVGMPSEQQKEYNNVLSGVISLPDSSTKDIPNFLARMTRLRQACLSPSLYGGPAVSGKLTWIKDIVPSSDLPTLIFTNYAEFAKLIHAEIKGSVMLIGEQSASMRQASIDVFVNGKADVFILSASAGGFGLNLQRAKLVIWTDLPWTPDVWEQGTGRAYRQGQTEEVHEIVLGHKDSIDGKVFRILRQKSRVADEVSTMIEVWKQLKEDANKKGIV
jgi:SNF2 family DNA or RNA helicase